MSISLPQAFVQLMESYPWEYSRNLLEALSEGNPSLAVRVNTAKGAAVPCGAQKVEWDDRGFYLDTRPVFPLHPQWHQGLFYVQDASSMATATVLSFILQNYIEDNSGLCYLDACAAPGGKTIAALDILPPDAFVVANEADKRRANILAENVAKHGCPNVAITLGDACRFAKLRDTFHIIAADVPCSGEGMMRKDLEAVGQWSLNLVESCAAVQTDILDALWGALKPGGFLIYSTCTFNRRENEDRLEYMVSQYGAEIIELPLSLFPGAVAGFVPGVARFLPGMVRGEGQFVALLHKPGRFQALQSKKKKSNSKACKIPSDVSDFVEKHIIDHQSYIIKEYTPGCYCIVPKGHEALIESVGGVSPLIRQGLPVVELKGKTAVPSHLLAMSTALRRGSFPAHELDYAAAMAYLRGEALSDVPQEISQGFYLTTYANQPLGFAKNIGRRANNLYPDALRLKMSPQSVPSSAPVPIISQEL